MVGANFHLVVSDLILESPKYLRFYRGRLRQGDFVILDSPAFETGQQTDLQDTVHAVQLLRPSEVVLPDDINSAENTVDVAEDAIAALVDIGYTGRVMMVPHGSSLSEFAKCFDDLLDLYLHKRITIGLQEEIPELFGMSRQEMIHYLNQRYGSPLTYHLLGVDEKLEDQHVVDARSCDTAKFVVWGLNGWKIDPGQESLPEYPGRKSVGGRTGYFQFDTAERELIECAQYNVRVWRENV